MRPCSPDASLPAREEAETKREATRSLKVGPGGYGGPPLRLSAPNPPPRRLGPSPFLAFGNLLFLRSQLSVPRVGIWRLWGPFRPRKPWRTHGNISYSLIPTLAESVFPATMGTCSTTPYIRHRREHIISTLSFIRSPY